MQSERPDVTTRLDQSDVRSKLWLEDDIGIADAVALKAGLMEALAAGREISLNVDGVTGLDVTAVQLLVAAERDAAAAGLDFSLDGELPAVLASLISAMGLKSFPGERSAE
jgi:anti-anti-sigma regulatory factor